MARAPLKIFILAGQSNMVGKGHIPHLDDLVADPKPDNQFRDILWDSDTKTYKKFDDVYVLNDKKHGKLTVDWNSGFSTPGNFGPEVMFGRTVVDTLDENEKPIFLIKTAWGGKSLEVDFRPPSSGIPPDTKDDPKQVGTSYRTMIQDVKEALENLQTYVPGYTPEQGYELAGFAWLQGWNDVIYQRSVNEYGHNLSNLIRDVRKDLDSPNLPFVIGELGQHGLKDGPGLPPQQGDTRLHLELRKQQEDVTLMDEFRDNSIFVRTACFVVHEKPNFNGAYHYNGRADTFFYIGKAMGDGMNTLLKKKTTDQECPVAVTN